MVVHFAFLFHIYQPPVQIPTVLKQIVEESYKPLILSLRQHPHARITLNINGTLVEQLADYGFNDIIDGLAVLAARGQVEFTSSAKFHPLLPLIPPTEVERQIELNDQTNSYFFGEVYKPRGFFPPEMAVSDELFPVLKRKGFDWAIMGGIASTLDLFPFDTFSRHPNGLVLVFRDDLISLDCAFDRVNNVDAFINRIKYRDDGRDYYVVLAMDGETLGHHVKHGFTNFFNPLLDALPGRNDVKMSTVSELIDTFPEGGSQVPRASSWSTMSYDIDRDVPFPLWFDPNNDLHVQQHRFTMYAVVLVNLVRKYKEAMTGEQRGMFDNARNFLDRGIHSCQTWWASKRPWYSPDMILRGLGEILLAVVNARRSIPDNAPDIKEAATLIVEDMLLAQNKIVESLL